MRSSWETLALGEGGLTAGLAGWTAVRFLQRHAQERRPGRQTAALALGLCAAGAALLSLEGIARDLGAEHVALLSVLAGLPALAGQSLMALMVARSARGSRQE